MRKQDHTLRLIFENDEKLSEYVEQLDEQLLNEMDPFTIAAALGAGIAGGRAIGRAGGIKGALRKAGKSLSRFFKGDSNKAADEATNYLKSVITKKDSTEAEITRALYKLKMVRDGISEKKFKDLQDNSVTDEDLNDKIGDMRAALIKLMPLVTKKLENSTDVGGRDEMAESVTLTEDAPVSTKDGQAALKKDPQSRLARLEKTLNSLGDVGFGKRLELPEVSEPEEPEDSKEKENHEQGETAADAEEEEKDAENSAAAPDPSAPTPTAAPAAPADDSAADRERHLGRQTDSRSRDGDLVLERWQRIAGILR